MEVKGKEANIIWYGFTENDKVFEIFNEDIDIIDGLLVTYLMELPNEISDEFGDVIEQDIPGFSIMQISAEQLLRQESRQILEAVVLNYIEGFTRKPFFETNLGKPMGAKVENSLGNQVRMNFAESTIRGYLEDKGIKIFLLVKSSETPLTGERVNYRNLAGFIIASVHGGAEAIDLAVNFCNTFVGVKEKSPSEINIDQNILLAEQDIIFLREMVILRGEGHTLGFGNKVMEELRSRYPNIKYFVTNTVGGSATDKFMISLGAQKFAHSLLGDKEGVSNRRMKAFIFEIDEIIKYSASKNKLLIRAFNTHTKNGDVIALMSLLYNHILKKVLRTLFQKTK